MAGRVLHVFAVNEPLEGRHTYLSRAQGEGASLPDLNGWLGLGPDGLDTDEIELFPTADLAGMALADYVRTAFDLKTAPNDQTSARMNALEGHVLLVPDIALTGEASPSAQLTNIATLPLAQPDHSSDALAAATPQTAESVLPTEAPAPSGSPSTAFLWMSVIGLLVVVIALYLMIGG